MDRIYIGRNAKSQSQQREKKNIIIIISDSIMKTLCFTLGLLLLTACCCNAMPKALQFNTAPGNCCFNVCTRSLPLKRVSSIAKTHSSCLKQAFIVQTIKGRQICYSGTFQWALDVYNQLHIDNSIQQH
ncbi:C-C motif chemokine 4-like [Anarrhichthys ocellatus]|uniref:C-C motif chemokine 4-like n=1 Tax=Anarrhichthys ocellatus TaxID=433405 RepID=UPI0012ED5911|nr:C-C motif chemokine 4-like [Anarrhichthys ocellatus]